jgi:hypothetical protein
MTMEFSGIGSADWVVLCFIVAILAGWPGLALLALLSLSGRGLAPTTQAVRALMIVAIPFLGLLTFWIMRPGGDADPLRARTAVSP